MFSCFEQFNHFKTLKSFLLSRFYCNRMKIMEEIGNDVEESFFFFSLKNILPFYVWPNMSFLQPMLRMYPYPGGHFFLCGNVRGLDSCMVTKMQKNKTNKTRRNGAITHKLRMILIDYCSLNFIVLHKIIVKGTVEDWCKGLMRNARNILLLPWFPLPFFTHYSH